MQAGIHAFMIGAMDEDMLAALVTNPKVTGKHAWYMNAGITKNDLGWGSQNFHRMGRCGAARAAPRTA